MARRWAAPIGRLAAALLLPLLLQAQAQELCVVGGCSAKCLDNNGAFRFPCSYQGTSYSNCPAAPSGVNYGTSAVKATVGFSGCGSGIGAPPGAFHDVQHTLPNTRSTHRNNLSDWADSPILANNATLWFDRTYYLWNVDPDLAGIKFIMGYHKNVKSGWIHFTTTFAGDLYVFAEKSAFTTEGMRDGGFSGLDWASVGGELTDKTLSFDGQICDGVEGCKQVHGDFNVWKVPVEAFERLTLPVAMMWTGGMAFDPYATTTTTTSTTSTVSSTTTSSSTATTTTTSVSTTTTTSGTTTSTTRTITTTSTTNTRSTTTFTTTTLTGTSTTVSSTTRSTTSSTTTTTTTTTTTATSTTATSTTVTVTSTTETTTTSTTSTTTTTTFTSTTTTLHSMVEYEGACFLESDNPEELRDFMTTTDGQSVLQESLAASLCPCINPSLVKIQGVCIIASGSSDCDFEPLARRLGSSARRLESDLKARALQGGGSLGFDYVIEVASVAVPSTFSTDTFTNPSVSSSISSSVVTAVQAQNISVTITGVSMPAPSAVVMWSDPDQSTSTTTTSTTTTVSTTTHSTTTLEEALWDKYPKPEPTEIPPSKYMSNIVASLAGLTFFCGITGCICVRTIIPRVAKRHGVELGDGPNLKKFQEDQDDGVHDLSKFHKKTARQMRTASRLKLYTGHEEDNLGDYEDNGIATIHLEFEMEAGSRLPWVQPGAGLAPGAGTAPVAGPAPGAGPDVGGRAAPPWEQACRGPPRPPGQTTPSEHSGEDNVAQVEKELTAITDGKVAEAEELGSDEIRVEVPPEEGPEGGSAGSADRPEGGDAPEAGGLRVSSL